MAVAATSKLIAQTPSPATLVGTRPSLAAASATRPLHGADVFEIAAKHSKPHPTPTPVPTPAPAPGPTPAPTSGDWNDLSDKALIQALHDHFAKHDSISYSQARMVIFSKLDNHDGVVHDVYTNRDLKTDRPPNSSDMNVEHTWPKSLGVKGTPAESDLHHLFPTDSVANSRRSSFPFGVVTTSTWANGGSKLGKDASGATVFEPPDQHKGNVARAIFYIATMYNMHIPAAEEAVLKQWNMMDAPDAAEIARNDAIEAIQHNRNPYVDDVTLANRIADF